MACFSFNFSWFFILPGYCLLLKKQNLLSVTKDISDLLIVPYCLISVCEIDYLDWKLICDSLHFFGESSVAYRQKFVYLSRNSLFNSVQEHKR